MRTTITLPDDLAREAQQLLDDRSFSDFARESIALRVSQLKHERLALEMKEGYEADYYVDSKMHQEGSVLATKRSSASITVPQLSQVRNSSDP